MSPKLSAPDNQLRGASRFSYNLLLIMSLTSLYEAMKQTSFETSVCTVEKLFLTVNFQQCLTVDMEMKLSWVQDAF